MENTSKKTTLMEQFPLIRTRQEVWEDIQNNPKLRETFDGWEEWDQNYFLDICSGARGVKMLYDSFFKEIFNPDTVPHRLERLLSLIIGQDVKILKVLPNESTRIADEGSLLIMDIIVEMTDGSIANIECQKVGYTFPGQRAACYSADLLMRQYRRMRKENRKTFKYSSINKVYSIIFFEQSPQEFSPFREHYIHHSRQQIDTGVQLELVQEYIFLCIDIFFKYHHNKGDNTEIAAWLTFLGSDRPEDIIELIERYPEFRSLYEDVYTLCRNTEKVMDMFSKELLELDRNTAQYMIDEMQKEIDVLKTENDAVKAEIDSVKTENKIVKAENDAVKAENDAVKTENEVVKAENERFRQMLAAHGIDADSVEK